MALTTNEQTEVLFKTLLNVPYNLPESEFNAESNVPITDMFEGSDLLTQPIPQQPILIDKSAYKPVKYRDLSIDKYEVDNTGVLERFTRLKLKKVPNSSNSYYQVDIDGNVMTNRSFQFNKLYKNQSEYIPYEIYIDDEFIDLADPDYRPIFDYKSGYVTFYGRGPTQDVYLTFTRYIGRTGLDNLVVSTLSISNENINLTINNSESKPLDISTSTTSFVINDASNQIEIDGNVRISKNLYVDGSYVTLDIETLEIHDNVVVIDKNADIAYDSISDPTYQFTGIEIEMPKDRSNYFFGIDIGEKGSKLREDISNNEKPIYFRIGLSNNLQSIATRIDDISNGALSIWDASNHQYTYYDTLRSDSSGHIIIGSTEVKKTEHSLYVNGTTMLTDNISVSYENVNVKIGDSSNSLLDVSGNTTRLQVEDPSGVFVTGDLHFSGTFYNNGEEYQSGAFTVSGEDAFLSVSGNVAIGISPEEAEAKLDISGTTMFRDDATLITSNLYSYPDAEEDPEFVRYRNLSDLERLMVGLTESPPKFDFDLSASDTVSITIKWRKSQIYTDLSFDLTTSFGSGDLTTFPNVQSIGLDIQVGNGDWKTYTTHLNKDDISFIFQTGQTYGDITITNPDQSFNARIYPINDINRSRPATSNYLLFSDLSIKPAGSPAQPTIVSFTEPTNTAPYQLSVITRSPNDFDINTDGNQSIPPLSHVRYKIQLKDQSSTKRMITIPSGQFDLLNTYEFTLDSVFTQLSTDMPTNSIALTSGPFSSIFLYYDTSYSIVTEVKNNGNDGTTPYSVESIKSYFTTGLPLPSSFGTTNPTITDNIQRTNGYVSRDKYIHGENSEKPSYLNIYYDAWNFRFNNNNGNNTFVVNPNDPGKDVDQSGGTKTTLSTVRTYYELTNGSQLQLSKADYYGYESSTGSIHTPDITINSNFPLVVVSTSDMATGNNQGYFIKGEFSPQQDFSGGYVNTFTGINPSRNVYKIGYDISINNGTDYFLNQEFILDDLSGAPTLSIDSSSILITSTETMYGIPSVTDYEVSLTATGSNLSRKVLPQHSYGLSISIDGNSENYTITLGQETITKNKRRTFSLPDSNNSGTKQYTSNISANSFNILTNANIESTPTITDTIRSSNVWYRDYFSLHRIDSAPTTYYAQTDTDGKTPFDSEFYTGNTLSLKDKQTTIVGESIYQALFKDGGFTSKSGDYIDYSSQGYETQYSNGNSFTFPDYSGLTTFPKYVIQVFNDGSKHDKTIKLNGNLLTHTLNTDVSVNIICSDTITTISDVSKDTTRRTTILSPYIVNESGSAGEYFDESKTGTGCINSNNKLILPTALAYTIVIIRLTNGINKQLNITFV
jgi:hypothetical protein